MPGTALFGIGTFGASSVRRLRAAAGANAPSVLVIAAREPPPQVHPPADIAAGAVTRTAHEFATVVLPPLPREAQPPPLGDGELIAPAPVTVEALAAALATPPGWLPALVRDAPEAWLRAQGDPPRLDSVAARLLWPRIAREVEKAVDERALTPGSRATIFADIGTCPFGAGLVVDLARAIARSGPALTIVIAALPPAGEAGRALDAAEGVLLELARMCDDAPAVRLLVLGPGTAASLFDLLPEQAAAIAAPGRYRGASLAFGVVRGVEISARPAVVQWHLAASAVAAALDRLLLRPEPPRLDGCASPAAQLFARTPLPPFAAHASRPVADLLRETKALVFAPPTGTESHEAARRRLDQAFARRGEELADRVARYDAEVNEWLQGGKISRLGSATGPGFLPELARALLERVAADGIATGQALLAGVGAELRARGAGGPRSQLGGRIRDLEARLRAPAARASGGVAGAIGSLIGRATGGRAEEEGRVLAEHSKAMSELIRLREVAAILEAAHELGEKGLECVARLADELEGLRKAALLVQGTLAERTGPAAASTSGSTSATSAAAIPVALPDLAALAAESGLDPAALLRRALLEGALTRWAQAPQELLDDLWAKALVPLSGAALLGRATDLGARLRDELEAQAPGWDRDSIPRGLKGVARARLRAPSDPIARAAAARLDVAAETVVQPGGDGVALVWVDEGLPAFALLGRAEEARRGKREEQALLDEILDATLAAPGLAELAHADRLLTTAAARFEGTAVAPEADVLAALAPVVDGLRKSAEVSDPATRLHYLESARAALEEWGRHAAASLVEPERARAADAAARFGLALERDLAAARGRAELKLALRTRRLALHGASTTIEVEVASHGRVAAEEVEVTLEPGDRHRVLGEGRVALGRLPAGASSVASFTLRPHGPGPLRLGVTARFTDLLAKGNEVRLEDEVQLFEARRGFVKIETNPFIAGPPVKTDRMFFGRSEVFSFLRENLQGRFQSNVIVLHGNRRTGKSSILYQLERGDRLAPFVPVYLDLQGLGKLTTGSLFAALSKRLARAFAGRGIEPPDVPSREALEGDTAFEAMNDFLEELQGSPLGGPRVLVMLDEFEVLEDKAREGRIDRELFGWLRSLMQHSERLAFLLAGTHRLSELDPVLWAPLLSLALYRHVGFLGEGETRSLVQEPLQGEVEFDDLALEGILRLTGGHPYYVQLLCQLLVSLLNEKARSNVVQVEQIGEAAERVLDAGGGQFLYEWGAPRKSDARLALAALADLAETAAVWVDEREIGRHAGLSAEAADVGLRELLARDLVLGSGGGYRVRVDLFRQWVRRQRPLARARTEALAEAQAEARA